MKAAFITRCDIGWYVPNGTPYRKALEVVSRHETTLCVSAACRIPPEIETRAASVVRFRSVFDLLKRGLSPEILFTGFDFPCLAVAARLRRLQ